MSQTEQRRYDAEESKAILLASRDFAKPNALTSTWQLLSTLAIITGVLALASWLGPSPLVLLLAPIAAGLFVRVFVFQHDLGHRSMYASKRTNDAVGLALSFITSVPFEAWRTEHNWHHNHQGRLSKRGVDNMNSPMTLEEVPEDLPQARYRIDKIKPINIFLIGAYSILVERKYREGFFPFREKFTDKVHNREQMLRGIYLTLPMHVLFEVGIALVFGWWVTLLVMLPAMVIGSGIGGLLFWVQHNFEHTYYDEDDTWNKSNVAVFGSSFLKLDPVSRWFTAHIGLHHVHHLNPRIPNYKLEPARRAIPALEQVAPLEPEAIRRSFTHIFWDRDADKMRPPEHLDDLK